MTKKRFIFAFASVILPFLLFTGPVQAQDTDEAPSEAPTITDILQEEGNHTMLLEAIDRVGLTSTLTTDGPFTLFAPTDEAFRAMGNDVIEMMDDDELLQLLRNHIVAEAVSSDELSARPEVMTITGQSRSADGASIGEAEIVSADLEAANGMVHAIDRVLTE
ncbi:MAG: fasciclin domain-containing protein [Bacteroidetes bacterium]|jgi:uncharacterized surface protein with fasciclin (FAS1) repeats|nr:fasciclin domain-containing protein [Bacteroidota bacterium]